MSHDSQLRNPGSLPRAALREDLFAPLADTLVGPHVAEHARLVQTHRDATQALRLHLENERKAAAADRALLATASRAGEDDPGTPNTDAWTTERDRLTRRVSGLTDAVHATFTDLVSAIADNADNLHAAHARETEAHRTRLLDATETAQDAIEALDNLAAVSRLVHNVTEHGTDVKAKATVPRPLLQSGARHLFAADLLQIIATYRQDLA